MKDNTTPRQKVAKIALSVFCHFFWTAVTITLIIGTSVLISVLVTPGTQDWGSVNFDWNYKPTFPPLDPEYANYTVLLDGHSHTIFSDGKMTPEQNLQWHIANGFNAIVVTDHQYIDGALAVQKLAREKYDDKIKVIIGMEYTCCRFHMNLIGINETIEAVAWPSDEEIQSIINRTHAMGGVASLNHRKWSQYILPDAPSLAQLFSWGLDYLEVGHPDGIFDIQGYNFCQQHGMGIISGTDMHSPDFIYGWTTLTPKNFTEEAIMDELRARKTSLILNALDSPYISPTPPYSYSFWWLDPFFRVGSIFVTYYSTDHPMYSFTTTGWCGPLNPTVDVRGIVTMVFTMLLLFAIIETSVRGCPVLCTHIKMKVMKKKQAEMTKAADMLLFESEAMDTMM